MLTCSCCGVGVPGNDRAESVVNVVKVVKVANVKFKVERVERLRGKQHRVILRS
jgi:hypothetical protein